MKRTFVCLILGCLPLAAAQDLPVRLGNSVTVQRLFKLSGTLSDRERGGFGGMVALRFKMYNEPYGGEPYWRETQNVRPDTQGRYTVLLGEDTLGGLPTDIFSQGGIHWLGVQAPGQPEQPRMLLVGLPSTMKTDSVTSSASVSQSTPSKSATERYLTALLVMMFLLGIGLIYLEALRWWRWRLQQYGPPPFAELLSSMPSRDQLRSAAQVLRFPLSERFRAIRGRLLHPTPSMEEDRPEKAA